jgi:drug/metabolite transporter (DMT)-like permease
MSPKDVFFCSLVALSLPLGQILFKFAALKAQHGPQDLVLRTLTNWPLFLAFALYGLSSLLWYFILMRVPLVHAYPFSILGSALVPLAGWLFFKESVSAQYFVGYALLFAGFFIAVSSS